MIFPLVLAQIIFAIAAILFIIQSFTDYDTKARQTINKIIIYFATAAIPINLGIIIYCLTKIY